MAVTAPGPALRTSRPVPPTWLRDLVAAIIVIGLSFVSEPARPYALPALPVLVAVTFAACALPLRRRWPIAIAALMTALYAAVALFTETLSPGLEIAVALAVFAVGNRTNLRTGTTVTIAVALAMVGATWAELGALWDPRVLQTFFVIAFSGAVGDAVRMHQQHIVAITERALRAEQTRESEAKRRVSDERLRIARDLHDAVAHEIAVINLHAGVATKMLDTDPEQTRESLGAVHHASRAVLHEIGSLLELLRAEDSGADAAELRTPQPQLDQLDALVARFTDAGLTVTRSVEGELSRVSGATGRVAYRVVQEALTNAFKHGPDRRAHLAISLSDAELRITVANPLPPHAGAQPPRQETHDASGADDSPGTGFGLAGLRDQVASVRGQIEAGAVAGEWRLTAELPLQSGSPATGTKGTA